MKGVEGKAITELHLVGVIGAYIQAGQEVRRLLPLKRSENLLRNLST